MVVPRPRRRGGCDSKLQLFGVSAAGFSNVVEPTGGWTGMTVSGEPQMAEDTAELPKTVSRFHVQQRVAEQMLDNPVPQTLKNRVGCQDLSQDRAQQLHPARHIVTIFKTDTFYVGFSPTHQLVDWAGSDDAELT